MSYVSVDVVDAAANVVPYIDDLLINYQIAGKGKIAGVATGNPADASSFQQPRKKVFHGRGLVIVQPNGSAGTVTLTANGNGLKSGNVQLILK